MTLTIEIPDEVANRVLSLPDLQREQLAIHAVVNAWQTAANEEDEVWELSDDDIAAINEGIADAEAGRYIALEELQLQRRGKDGPFASLLSSARVRVAESDARKSAPKH